MQITYQLDEIYTVANQVWELNKQNKVWLFQASMGSGKTTFINALCKILQIEEVSGSPTFSIINEYESNIIGTVYHLDLYRLKDESEAIECGVEDVLYSNKYCFVEWPEQAQGIMPKDASMIRISFVDSNTRMLEIM
jgi:tRNA threonylcarbamoyladenosine biosynthesis protein TsaE